MVKMQIAGIQIEVPEGEVSLYKRAGYSVLVGEPEPAAPVEAVEADLNSEPEPAKKKASKKE